MYKKTSCKNIEVALIFAVLSKGDIMYLVHHTTLMENTYCALVRNLFLYKTGTELNFLGTAYIFIHRLKFSCTSIFKVYPTKYL